MLHARCRHVQRNIPVTILWQNETEDSPWDHEGPDGPGSQENDMALFTWFKLVFDALTEARTLERRMLRRTPFVGE